MPDRPFRVIDGNGEVDDDAQVLPSDYATLEELNRKLRREIAALKGQLTKLRKVEDDAETVQALLVHWRNACRGPDSRVLIDADSKRAEAVRRMLRRIVAADRDPLLASTDKAEQAAATIAATERAAERIRTAIDAAARYPFQHYSRRYAEHVEGSTRRDDITHILADERRFERLEALIDCEPKRLAYRAELWRRLQREPRLRDVLATLDPEHSETIARCIRWCQCNPR